MQTTKRGVFQTPRILEDKTVSTEAVNTGGPSACKQIVKYECNIESEVVDEEVGTDFNDCSQKGLLSTKG